MNIEVILKGYTTSNGEFRIINSIKSETMNHNLGKKYKRKVLIKIFTSDMDLSLKAMMKLKTEEMGYVVQEIKE